MRTRVSIIIPVFNAEKTLELCINSAIHQSYHDIEIILIDDGSTDASLIMCRKYAIQDPRVICISQANSGPYMAKKRGIEYANGEVLMFLDSDDYYPPTMCEDLLKIYESGDYDIVESGYRVVNPSGEEQKKYHRETSCIIEGTMQIFNFYYHQRNMIAHSLWSKLYKRKLFENIVEIPIRKWDDVLFLVQVLYKANRIFISANIHYFYVVNVTGITASRNFSILSDELIVGKFLYNYHILRHKEFAKYELCKICFSMAYLYYYFYKSPYKSKVVELLSDYNSYFYACRKHIFSILSFSDALSLIIFRLSPKLFLWCVRIFVTIKRYHA